MQQSGYNDMQLLQQNLLYKQLHELQRQQQLQHLGDNRPQHSFNELAKPSSGALFSPLINGVPVNDESNVLRNRMQMMESAPGRGSFDRSMFMHEQNNALRSMNPVQQQFDISLCGTPISESRVGMTQFSYMQGSPSDSMNLFPKSNNHDSKRMMLTSGMNNMYSEEQSGMQLELGVPEDAFANKQGFPEKSADYQIRSQGLVGGFFTRNLQEDNSLHVSDSPLPEFSGRHGEVEWHGMQRENKQSGPSQEMVPLDPLEAKILYNTDCNIWEAFGDQSNMTNECFGSTMGNACNSVSIQSGSWSALMQSAVAEASNADTGPQERWSGLNLHNLEGLNGNQATNTMISGKLKSNWDANLQSASHGSKSISSTNDLNSFFPGFHHSDRTMDESQKVQMPSHAGNPAAQATGNLKSDIQSKKLASSAFMKFEKGLEHTEKVQHQRSDNFHNSTEVANETYGNRKDYYQMDCTVSNVINDPEPSHLEQMKVFSSNSNSIADVEKSVTAFAGDVISSRETFAGQQLNMNNQTRSMLSDVLGDDPSTTSRFSNQSPMYSQLPGLSRSPSLQKQPYYKGTPSASANVEYSNSYPGQAWNDISLNTTNFGISSQWKTANSYQNNQNELQLSPLAQPGSSMLPSGDERHHNIPQFPSEDNFPILEASTVRQTHFLPATSHQSEDSASSLNLWRAKPAQQGSYNSDSFRPLHQFPSPDESPKLVPKIAHFNGKSEPTLLSLAERGEAIRFAASQKGNQSEFSEKCHKDEIIQKQELDSFSFHPVSRPPQSQSLDRIVQGQSLSRDDIVVGEKHLQDNSSKFSNAEYESNLPNFMATGDAKLFKEDLVTRSDVAYVDQSATSPSSAINSLSSEAQGAASLPLSPSPPWLMQYGATRNGHVLQSFDANQLKSESSVLSVGRSTQISSSFVERLDSALVSSQLPSASVLPLDPLNEESLVRPKKRKAEVSHPLPWRVQVSQESRMLPSLSVAEQSWARAANRLFEKAENEVTYDDIVPVKRSKRRITLISQLMQILFPPLPSPFFSTDFSATGCDFLLYHVARLSLGETCSLLCSKENDVPRSASGNTTDVEQSTSNIKSRDARFEDSLEFRLSRLKRLENDFQRLEKTPTIADLRTELQELEKFAVINRFAKFHGRGPADASASSSLVGLPRVNLQRYVTAFPLPSNLPEEVTCLPL